MARPPLFSTIIEADHSDITTLSVAVGKLLSPHLARAAPATTAAAVALHKQRLAQLHALAWRLVRHDLCEDVVMRPAFEKHLGAAGKAMGDRDRADHERARVELVRLYAAVEALAPTTTGDDISRLAALRERYLVLMADLAGHMRSESGEDIPRLEAAMGRAESEKLARRYVETMVVQPGLRIAGRRVWPDVAAYLATGLEGLRRVWDEVLLDGERRRCRSSKL